MTKYRNIQSKNGIKWKSTIKWAKYLFFRVFRSIYKPIQSHRDDQVNRITYHEFIICWLELDTNLQRIILDKQQIINSYLLKLGLFGNRIAKFDI